VQTNDREEEGIALLSRLSCRLFDEALPLRQSSEVVSNLCVCSLISLRRREKGEGGPPDEEGNESESERSVRGGRLWAESR
jgi:hypothetical protein